MTKTDTRFRSASLCLDAAGERCRQVADGWTDARELAWKVSTTLGHFQYDIEEGKTPDRDALVLAHRQVCELADALYDLGDRDWEYEVRTVERLLVDTIANIND